MPALGTWLTTVAPEYVQRIILSLSLERVDVRIVFDTQYTKHAVGVWSILVFVGYTGLSIAIVLQYQIYYMAAKAFSHRQDSTDKGFSVVIILVTTLLNY
jgi:hypothetical protein